MTTFVIFLSLLLGGQQLGRGHGRGNPHNPPQSCGKVWSHGHWIFLDCNAPAPLGQ